MRRGLMNTLLIAFLLLLALDILQIYTHNKHVNVSHQHIQTVCCRGEVQGLVASVHGDVAESAAIAWVRVILNSNLLSILQTCRQTVKWVCSARVHVHVYSIGALLVTNTRT